MQFDFQTVFGNSRVGSFRRVVLGWPAWARIALIIPMVPGILLIALSLLLFLVSLIALFVLTAPVYALLSRLFNVRNVEPEVVVSPGSKRVEATIRDV